MALEIHIDATSVAVYKPARARLKFRIIFGCSVLCRNRKQIGNLSEIMRNANLMQLGNFIDVFLALHVSGAYAHHQEH